MTSFLTFVCSLYSMSVPPSVCCTYDHHHTAGLCDPHLCYMRENFVKQKRVNQQWMSKIGFEIRWCPRTCLVGYRKKIGIRRSAPVMEATFHAGRDESFVNFLHRKNKKEKQVLRSRLGNTC